MNERQITDLAEPASVRLELIDPDPTQPRKTFRELGTLQASIASLGLLQPPLLAQTPDGRFRIIDGERRFRALLELAKLDPERWATIPALVVPWTAPTSRAEDAAAQLTANNARAALRPWEVGASLLVLWRQGLTLPLIAQRSGLSKTACRWHLAVAEGLHPRTVAELEKLPVAQTSLSYCLTLAQLPRDEIGQPDADAQIAVIKRKLQGYRQPPPGKYSRALERRRVVQKLHSVRLDLLPQLGPLETRVVRALLHYLETDGPIRPFSWELDDTPEAI